MRASLLAIAAAGALASTPGATQTVKDGVDAWQRGDYQAAVGVWRPLAAKGDGDAAFDLGQAYKLGRGVPTDLAQAKTLYGQAARAGHVQAAANYGLLLFQDGDRRGAMPWIEKAAGAGDPRAQYVYGTALFNGDVATKDWPRAYALMTRAAAAGLPQATTSIAQMDRYLSAADRAKGLQLAQTMAAAPLPPIGRQGMTTGSAAPAPIQSAAAKPPAPVRAKPATPAIATGAAAAPPARKAASAAAPGGWQVQLGAFGSEAAAKASWTTLSAKAAGLRGLRPAYVHAGAVVRLRGAGLADRAAADKACASAKAAGGACFAVPPGG